MDHALTCRFLEAKAPALLVAKAHVLDVYRVQVRKGAGERRDREKARSTKVVEVRAQESRLRARARTAGCAREGTEGRACERTWWAARKRSEESGRVGTAESKSSATALRNRERA